jgi:hypothetical protein
MDDDEQRGRQWFENYVAATERAVNKPSQPGVLYNCPCCGYPTLSERGGYEICELCNWEDDGQDDPHASEMWGGPNKAYTLADARVNFKRYLIMYDPARPATRAAEIATHLRSIKRNKQWWTRSMRWLVSKIRPFLKDSENVFRRIPIFSGLSG